MSIPTINIYFYIDKVQFLSEAVYLCKKLNIVPLVKDKVIFDALYKMGVRSTKVSNYFILFYFQVIRLDVQLIFLTSDTLSPYAQLLQRKFKAITLNDIPFDFGSEYYQNRSHDLCPCNIFFKILFFIFNLKSESYGRRVHMLPCRLNDVVRYVVYKIFYGFRFKKDLQGFFSDIVLLPREEMRDVYLDNGFDREKLRVVDSPTLSYLSNLKKECNPINKDIDVLLVSQPLYRYDVGFQWLEEVSNLVIDCDNSKLKLYILLHPRDDPDKYSVFASKCIIVDSQKVRSSVENLKYIKRSKLVVIKSSSMRILPYINKTPVAYINYCNVNTLNSTLRQEYHPDLILESLGDIASVFDLIIKSRQKYINIQNNYLNLKIGFHSERVCLKQISDAIDFLVFRENEKDLN
jgi:hypothetical protein